MEILRYLCTIARRGKKATGNVEVETFGVPVKPKTGDRIKKWSYDFVDALTFQQCVDAVEAHGKLNQRLLKEALFRGADLIAKSASIKAQSAFAGLVRFVLEQDLAEDQKKAENLVTVWQQTQSFMKRSMMAVPSIEDLAEQRRKYVAEQKEKGLWNPTLVTEPDSSEDDSEEDDDSEEL